MPDPIRVPLTTLPMQAGVVFVKGMGLYHFLTSHHHNRPSTPFVNVSAARFQGGVPCWVSALTSLRAGHLADMADKENTFHLHPPRPLHLASGSLTHQFSFLPLFEAPIAICNPRTGNAAGARDPRTRSCVQKLQHPCYVGVVPFRRVLPVSN